MSTEKEYPHEQPLPDNVVPLNIVTLNDVDPVAILRGAYEADLVDLVIVGVRKDGVEFFASSAADGAEAMYHLQRGIHKLNNIIDGEVAGVDNLGRS